MGNFNNRSTGWIFLQIKSRLITFSALSMMLIFSASCLAQQAPQSDEMIIKEKVDGFFEALEKQDTVLFKSLLFTNGQIWVARNSTGPDNYSTRYFHEDIKTFDPNKIIEETPLSYDIKIHKNIAVAWVPYELSISGKFSHCGIDVFTFIKAGGEWTIVNATYTIEPDGCDELKHK